MKAHVLGQLYRAPGQSNRMIACALGVSASTVGNTRKTLEAAGVIPRLDYTEGADGRCRPARYR